MAHMQVACNIRRRDHDRESFIAISFGLKKAALFPKIIDTPFYLLRVINFGYFCFIHNKFSKIFSSLQVSNFKYSAILGKAALCGMRPTISELWMGISYL